MPTPSDQNRASEWLAALSESGYRLTVPRRAIVEILAESDRALNATQIYDLGRETTPGLGLVSVYRTLEKLEDLGLIQRVHHPDGCQAYVANFAGHQHLLLCNRCGQIRFFHGDDLAPLITRVEQESGYRIGDHWLQLFGECEKCRRAGERQPGALQSN